MREKNVRKAALDLLCSIEQKGKYANLALDSALRAQAVKEVDRSLLTALVYGVIERKITLDYIISKLSKRDNIDTTVRNILRLGLFQLRYTDKIPPHAAVFESVSLAKNRGEAAFINALLREYQRRGDKIELPQPENTPYALSVKFSVAKWICRLFIDSFGLAKAKEILASFNIPPALTLRTNTLKISRDTLLSKIKESIALKAGALDAPVIHDIKILPTDLSPHGILLSDSLPLRILYGFEDGLFFVQDEASQLCVEALAPKAGQLVIDTCAAPGSKSFSAAMNMQNDGEILAFDIHKSRLALIDSGAEKLGIKIINTKITDAKKPPAELFNTADCVLCDVPCSGLGVIAKKPDIRYKEESTITRLPQIQLEILTASANYLKHGGTLIYSTCTLNPSENEEVVLRFLEKNPNFTSCDFSFSPQIHSSGGMLTLFPQKCGGDGFFIARMTKNG